jgi:hypothetical protein
MTRHAHDQSMNQPGASQWCSKLHKQRAPKKAREVVGFTQGHAAFDAAAGQPDGVAAPVVVAAVVGRGELALGV